MLHACLCCGVRTLTVGSPSWLTCQVCFWCDVPPADWCSNGLNLAQAQENYLLIGACANDWLQQVRAPLMHEVKADDWQPLKLRRAIAARAAEIQLKEAFLGVQREDGVSLHQAEVLDRHGSSTEIDAAQRLNPEEEWQNVSASDLAAFANSLVFLDNKGFRFYLPAYLLFMVSAWSAENSAANAFALHMKTYNFWWALSGNSYNRENHYKLLSKPQKSAVADLLRMVSELGDPDEADMAVRALEGYWQIF